MQLNDKTGIACDLCSLQHKQDFSYYSFDYRLVEVFNNQRVALEQLLYYPITSSMDICPACFETIKAKIISNYQRLAPKKVVYCEVSGEILKNNYIYYYCVVSKVEVKMSGQPNTCTKCKNRTFDQNKPCEKCGGREFIKVAVQNVVDRFVEFSIGDKSYQEFKSQMEKQRISTGQWTAK